eukprot:NODE_4493_length_1056_cov_113.080386_g4291_i0.p1 GENE.NODE_4493_length_1056_cov_113.080386_g4291_i0~~NODE_4493_length_1056_cov_113.080386_g4291_i0.p1  ORF type:complete len:281 (-),score=87.61 NODE_4493_length_1056_cov_113.080386_g4291_i0:143-985(-)
MVAPKKKWDGYVYGEGYTKERNQQREQEFETETVQKAASFLPDEGGILISQVIKKVNLLGWSGNYLALADTAAQFLKKHPDTFEVYDDPTTRLEMVAKPGNGPLGKIGGKKNAELAYKIEQMLPDTIGPGVLLEKMSAFIKWDEKYAAENGDLLKFLEVHNEHFTIVKKKKGHFVSRFGLAAMPQKRKYVYAQEAPPEKRVYQGSGDMDDDDEQPKFGADGGAQSAFASKLAVPASEPAVPSSFSGEQNICPFLDLGLAAFSFKRALKASSSSSSAPRSQ